MSRSVVSLVVFGSLLFACTKSAGNQDTGSKVATGSQKVMVPGGDPPEGAPGMGTITADPKGTSESMTVGGGGDEQFRLKPEEGKLAIEIPGEVKAGTEFTAKVTITPAGPYKINKEFPTKLTLESPTGITLAKAQLKAGGADQSKGDADAFEDNQLLFKVRMTAQPGSHTISGTFKFAVCDKDTCLAKKEQISIVVAAK